MDIRFNHMEITLPLGTLNEGFRASLDAFYGDVFGFTCTSGEMFGQRCHTMKLDNGSFILLMESDEPMSVPGFEHLGFEHKSRSEVDQTLAKVRQWQEKDERVQLRADLDGELDGRLYHAYYVKHLLPIWFDVQYSEPVASK
jgi:hypothetical protein